MVNHSHSKKVIKKGHENPRNLKRKDGGFLGVCGQFSRNKEGAPRCHDMKIKGDCKGDHIGQVATVKKVSICELHNTFRSESLMIRELERLDFEVRKKEGVFYAQKGEARFIIDKNGKLRKWVKK